VPIVNEVVPGIGTSPEGPYFCPGCWAAALRRDVPKGRELVEWFNHGLFIMESLGYVLPRSMNAADMARDYVEEPWHAEQ